MLVKAIVVILILLILSNMILRSYNYIYPPCNSIDEYFNSARLLPDGISASLGSIPTGTDVKHVGMKRVETPSGGIKLTDYSYKPPDIIDDEEFEKHIMNMFPSRLRGMKSNTDKKVEEVNGRIVVFNKKEGMTGSNIHMPKRRNIITSSGFVKRIKRDGYSDPRPNDW